MEFTRGSQLIQNLFLKRELLRTGNKEHEKIRPVLIILSGGMRGVSGAGSVIAFHLLGFGEVFDVVVGISTGAGIGAYFLGGLEQTLLGTSIYYRDLPPRFIKYFRRPVVDVDFVEYILRERKALNVEAVCASRSRFFVGATNLQSESLTLLDVKMAQPDPIAALKASMAVPGLYNKSVEVNGQMYVDGGAHPFPIRVVTEAFESTDILVITNYPRGKGEARAPSLTEKVCSSFFLRETSPRLRELWLSRHKRWYESLQFFSSLDGVNKGIIWASDNVGLLTRNPRKLRRAAENAVRATLDVFGEPRKAFQLL